MIPHSVPAIHAVHLADLVDRLGADGAALLELTGRSRTALGDPDERVRLSTLQSLAERAFAVTNEPALGWLLGLQMRITAHGHLGFAAMTAASTGDALELATRFLPTRTDLIELRVLREAGPRTAAITLVERRDLGSARPIFVPTLLIGIWQIGEALTGHTLDGRLELAMPAVPGIDARVGTLARRVRFDAPTHRLVFPATYLALPIALADPAAQRLALAQCERELQSLVDGGGSWPERVAAALQGPDGWRSLPEIAAELGVSPRSLKRRLSEAATTFSAVREQHLTQLSTTLLGDRSLSVAEVASHLGYADPANFSRAYKRWTGRTPRSARDDSRGSDA